MFYPPTKRCPCGTGRSFGACCLPRLLGEQPAETPEALMRSRYTAFALQGAPYILDTWHPSTRPAPFVLEGDPTRWLGLTIHAASQQGTKSGRVRFSARYSVGGKAGVQRENSRFVREGRRWYYLSGK